MRTFGPWKSLRLGSFAESRLRDRGLLMMEWAPQRILAIDNAMDRCRSTLSSHAEVVGSQNGVDALAERPQGIGVDRRAIVFGGTPKGGDHATQGEYFQMLPLPSKTSRLGTSR